MALVLAVLTGLGYGLLHGLGPDHCAALAALLARGEPRVGRAARVSLRFGLGHMGALGGLAVAAALTGVLIPPAFEQWAEVLGGGTLIVVGLLLLLRRRPEAVLHRHPHAHAHAHDGSGAHEHWHAHVLEVPADGGDAHAIAAPEHRHPHLSTIVGGALGASGARALALALPPLLIASRSAIAAAGFVVAFGAGVTASMVAMGLVLACAGRMAHRRPSLGRLPERIVGVGTVALGAWWIWASVP